MILPLRALSPRLFAHAKITSRRKQSCAVKFAPQSFFDFAHPPIERPRCDADQRNRTSVLDAPQKINAEKLQPPFPLRTPQRPLRNHLEIRNVHFRAHAIRTPLVSRRRRIQIHRRHVTARAVRPAQKSPQPAVTRMTNLKHFLRLHIVPPLTALPASGPRLPSPADVRPAHSPWRPAPHFVSRYIASTPKKSSSVAAKFSVAPTQAPLLFAFLP